jgi:hypothetical protein
MDHRKRKYATMEEWKETQMNTQPKPLAITIAATRNATGLSNSSVYGAINKGLLETVVVMGRRLVLYSSVERLLGIQPAGNRGRAAAPGLTGGPIKRPPGRHRKSAGVEAGRVAE